MIYDLRAKEKEQDLSICKRTERRYGKSWIVEKNLRKVFHSSRAGLEIKLNWNLSERRLKRAITNWHI